ncbi:MAG: helical backbone metal receptor, partial [Myxococcota bacterium]
MTRGSVAGLSAALLGARGLEVWARNGSFARLSVTPHPGIGASPGPATLPRMRPHPHRCSATRRRIGAALALLVLSLPASALADSPALTSSPPRLVSLNPSLTAILIALDARETLVGVDDYSARQQAAVEGLPRVGGLFNPSLEAVVALAPDRVVLVPSAEQRDFRGRLEALEIEVSTFENQRFDEVLDNIARLGRLVERQPQAADRIAAIRRVRAEITKRTTGLPAPRTLVVLQREPLFIVGRDNFVAEMLETAGGKNLGDAFESPYPRVGMEWVVESAPEVLIDMDPD